MLFYSLVIAGSLSFSAYAQGQTTCPDLSGLYLKKTELPGNKVVESLISLKQQNCNSIIVMERLINEVDGLEPHWTNQNRLIKFYPQGLAVDHILPLRFSDTWVKRESFNSGQCHIWDKRRFEDSSFVDYYFNSCGGNEQKIEFTPTNDGLDVEYYSLIDKKWVLEPRGIHAAGLYGFVKYKFVRLKDGDVSKISDLTLTTNRTIRITRTQANTVTVDLQRALSDQWGQCGGMEGEYLSPYFYNSQSNYGYGSYEGVIGEPNFVAHKFQNLFEQHPGVSIFYCKVNADIIYLNNTAGMWLLPYETNWCVPTLPKYKEYMACMTGAFPDIP